jgi:hypothetical protein
MISYEPYNEIIRYKIYAKCSCNSDLFTLDSLTNPTILLYAYSYIVIPNTTNPVKLYARSPTFIILLLPLFANTYNDNISPKLSSSSTLYGRYIIKLSFVISCVIIA